MRAYRKYSHELIEKILRKLESGDITNTQLPVATDSYAGGLVINNIQGKTEQNVYTGKNLFSMRKSNIESNGISVTVDNENQSFSASGTATNSINIALYDNYDEIKDKISNGGTFTMSFVNANFDKVYGNVTVAYGYDGRTNYINADGVPVTVPSGSSLYNVSLYVPSGKTVNLANVKIQLEESNVATEWEPYVGGMPSPSSSYQQEIKSVKGKNLFDCRDRVETTKNNVTFTPVFDENGNLLYINVNGTASADTSYGLGDFKLEGEFIATDLGGSYLKQSDGTWIKTISENEYLEIPTGSGYYLQSIIFVASGTVCDNVKYYPMIRSASIKDDTYVPYGLLRIKTRTKNILKRFTDTTLNGVDFSVDEKGIVTMNGISTAGIWYGVTLDSSYYTDGDILYVSGCDYSEDKGYCQIEMTSNGTINYSGFKNGEEIKIKVLPNTTKIRYVIYIKTGITLSNVKVYPMISKEGGEYEPYQSSEITLSEPIELNGFNGVYDTVNSDGVTRRFAKVVFDGSEDEAWVIDKGTDYCRYIINLPNPIAGSESVRLDNFVCTHGLYSMFGADTGCAFFYKTSTTNNFYIYANDITSLNDWKTFLQSNPMTVVYELATPTTEELSTTDIIALNSLKTFDGTTHVEVDCEVNPVIDMDYGCSKVGALSLENTNLITGGINKLYDMLGGYSIVVMSKSDYQSLETKDENTLYFIKG